LRQELETLITDMLLFGIIEQSNSPWSSPVILIQKKSGDYRFCIDFRRLNAATIKDAYPIPRMDDVLDALGNCKFFTILDLASGYWQIAMSETDKAKTAFCVPNGLYQFNVIPLGLTNAPGTFQRLMNTVLRRLNWKQCIVYLDDIIIF
jgi:hypothetical protein